MGSKNGATREVEMLAQFCVISVLVIAGLTCVSGIINDNLISVLVCAIIFVCVLLARHIVRLVFVPLKWIVSLPILNGADHFLGFIIGVAEATIIIWSVFYIIYSLGISIEGLLLKEYIEDSAILKLIFDTCPFVNIHEKWL